MSAYTINPTILAMMNQISEDERKHISRLQNAWRRYQGEWPNPLKVPPGQNDYYNLKVNFAREFVDASVTYLFGRDVGFELDQTTRERTENEEYLDTVWQANRKMSWLQKYAKNGSVTGHAFALIEPASEADGRPLPRLINLEPEIVWPMWDELDVDAVYRYKIQFNTTDRETGKPVVRRKDIVQDGDAWVIQDFVAREGDSRFVQVGEELWEYEFPPIVHNQNLPAPNEFWGIPDLTDDRLDLMHGINRLISNINKIVFNDAHKKLFGSGLSGQEGALSSWDIGEIKALPQGSEIKAVDTTADIAPSLEFVREMKAWLHEVTNIPEVAAGKVDGIGSLSGVALEILYQPLTSMTETKQMMYGDAINEINRRLLILDGRDPEDTTFVWPNILPVNEKERAETADIWAGVGVSPETLMERAGSGYRDPFDFDREQARKQASDAEFGARLIRQAAAGGDGFAVDD